MNNALRVAPAPSMRASGVEKSGDTRVTRATSGLDVVAELIKAGVQRFAERRAVRGPGCGASSEQRAAGARDPPKRRSAARRAPAHQPHGALILLGELGVLKRLEIRRLRRRAAILKHSRDRATLPSRPAWLAAYPDSMRPLAPGASFMSA